MRINRNCVYFRGDVPCHPHKETGTHCTGCTFYVPWKKRVLIIKLGALGDVIRTTPLIHRLQKEFGECQITWLTRDPEILPDGIIAMPLNTESISILTADSFDLLYNLDKEQIACALASKINASVKKGFIFKGGYCFPIDRKAYHKYLTGLFDDVNRKNTKSYQEEIFEMAGFRFKGESYWLPEAEKISLPNFKHPLIGLNTGAGSRWKAREYPVKKWIELAKLLTKRGFHVLLLGGPQEHKKNQYMAKQAGVVYIGHFPIKQFLSLVDACDCIVTTVTMALHIAIGLKKKVVLLNNIFNRHEFYLYGQGIILEPQKPCMGCYKQECNEPCMELIAESQIVAAVEHLLKKGGKRG
jgi:ADP-heptose:LPS heptosyltransferase